MPAHRVHLLAQRVLPRVELDNPDALDDLVDQLDALVGEGEDLPAQQEELGGELLLQGHEEEDHQHARQEGGPQQQAQQRERGEDLDGCRPYHVGRGREHHEELRVVGHEVCNLARARVGEPR
eukprot:scaffold26547_cov59-Phaeocystis_antarctica.AAC.2